MTERFIPEKCLTCPMVVKKQEHIASHEVEVDQMIQFAVSAQPEKISDIADRLFLGIPSTHMPENVAEQVRQQVSEHMEGMNEHIEESRRALSEYVLHCTGPVTIYGEANRRAYEVELCASQKITPSEDGIEVATVKRSRI